MNISPCYVVLVEEGDPAHIVGRLYPPFIQMVIESHLLFSCFSLAFSSPTSLTGIGWKQVL